MGVCVYASVCVLVCCFECSAVTFECFRVFGRFCRLFAVRVCFTYDCRLNTHVYVYI